MSVFILFYTFVFLDSTYKWDYAVNIFLWLASFSIILSRCIHAVTNCKTINCVGLCVCVCVCMCMCVCVCVCVCVFSSLQLLDHVRLFENPWTAAHQASLSITTSRSLLKFRSIELVMPSNHLILCHPLLLLPSIFPSNRVFSNEWVLQIRWPKYCSFSFNISPSN